MSNEFFEEIINAGHMRLLSPDWKIVQSGCELLRTIDIRRDGKRFKKDIDDFIAGLDVGYKERLKEVEKISDKIAYNRERLKIECYRLEKMIGFYDELNGRI
jgi:hypothetical protein